MYHLFAQIVGIKASFHVSAMFTNYKLDPLVPRHFLCYFIILNTFISPVKMKPKRNNIFICSLWFRIPEDQKTFFQDSCIKSVSKPSFLIR